MSDHIPDDIAATAAAFVLGLAEAGIMDDCDRVSTALAGLIAKERLRWCPAKADDVPIEPVGYLVHRAAGLEPSLSAMPPTGTAQPDQSGAEPLYSSAQVDVMRSHDRMLLAMAERAVDDAATAASDTCPSWKHRCHAIMSALGLDYGDPDWLMPDERRKLSAALARVDDLETRLGETTIGQAEAERLIDAEASLRSHGVLYHPDGATPWSVWKSVSGGLRVSSHRTRWDAIAAAEALDRDEPGAP